MTETLPDRISSNASGNVFEQGLTAKACVVDRDVRTVERAAQEPAYVQGCATTCSDVHPATLPADNELLTVQDPQRGLHRLTRHAVTPAQLMLGRQSVTTGQPIQQDRRPQSVRDLL